MLDSFPTRRSSDLVGMIELLQAGNVVQRAGIDLARLFVDRKEDGAGEAMLFGEKLGQHRHRFFGAIFIVAGDEDDVFAFAGAVAALIFDPRIVGSAGLSKESQSQNDCSSEGEESVHGSASSSRGTGCQPVIF